MTTPYYVLVDDDALENFPDVPRGAPHLVQCEDKNQAWRYFAECQKRKPPEAPYAAVPVDAHTARVLARRYGWPVRPLPAAYEPQGPFYAVESPKGCTHLGTVYTFERREDREAFVATGPRRRRITKNQAVHIARQKTHS